MGDFRSPWRGAVLDFGAVTSRQELDRVQAQTAAMLEATNAAIKGVAGSAAQPTASAGDAQGFLDASALQQTAAAGKAPANDDLLSEIKSLREEVTAMRNENNSGQAAIVGNTGRIDRRLEAVTSVSGGEAISVAGVAT